MRRLSGYSRVRVHVCLSMCVDVGGQCSGQRAYVSLVSTRQENSRLGKATSLEMLK